MTKPTATQGEGGRVLESHIRSTGRSIPVWCEEHGLAKQRVQIQRLISGERAKRVSVNLALAIERATDGAVPMAMWAVDPDESGAQPAIDAKQTG